VQRGGHLGYAADDPFLWNTSGIANVRELQLIHEAGLNPLEVIRSATYNSAITLRRPDLGLVKTGYTADLLIVDGNPLKNLRFLYAFGALDSPDGEIRRRGGIRWTIRAGVVFDNRILINEVLDTVAESKRNWTNPVPPLFEPVFQ
jgi:cytosine/adenosine deaminase-related metal-dependent hydrolase